jgi:hypothetical protein
LNWSRRAKQSRCRFDFLGDASESRRSWGHAGRTISGFREYLQKPVSVGEFLSTIDRLISEDQRVTRL